LKIENGAKEGKYCMKSGLRDGGWSWLMADGYWLIAEGSSVDNRSSLTPKFPW